MLLECRNCGAPLDLPTSTRAVRCAYCSRWQTVPSMQVLAQTTPDSWSAPAMWLPRGRLAGGEPLVRGAAARIGTGGCLLALMLVLSPIVIPILVSLRASLPWIGVATDGPADVTLAEQGVVRGVADGSIDLGTLWQTNACESYARRTPNALLTTATASALTFELTTTFPARVVVLDARGVWRCSDRSRAAGEQWQRRWTRTLPAGNTLVWVTRLDTNADGIFVLTITPAEP